VLSPKFSSEQPKNGSQAITVPPPQPQEVLADVGTQVHVHSLTTLAEEPQTSCVKEHDELLPVDPSMIEVVNGVELPTVPVVVEFVVFVGDIVVDEVVDPPVTVMYTCAKAYWPEESYTYTQ
jgi:hypothetical protein